MVSKIGLRNFVVCHPDSWIIEHGAMHRAQKQLG